MPADADYAPPVRQAFLATFPSTIGVTALAAVAVFLQPALTALLGGISAGLGVAALLRAPFVDPRLWFDPKTGRRYLRE